MIRLAPRDAVGYRVRGLAYVSKSVSYKKAFLLGRTTFAEFKGAIKIVDRAIPDFNEAIKIAPTDEDYSGRGYLYYEKRDFARAVADLSEAIMLNRSSVTAYAWRGEAHEAMGKRAKAIEDYNKAVALPAKTKWERDRQAEARQKLASLVPAAPVAALVPPAPVAAKREPAAGPLVRRVALVIGNAAYKVGPLPTPEGDAAAVAEALSKIGFQTVRLKRDLAVEGFRAALREFAREASGADLAVIYFTGHSIEAGRRKYLIPVDADLAEASDLDVEAIDLDAALAQAEGARKRWLVLVDASRSNPFPLAGARRYVVTPRWLPSTRSPGAPGPTAGNTLIIYAATPGTTVIDRTGPQHSAFTEAFLKHLATPGLEVRELFSNVSEDVMALTGRAQQPYIYGSLGPSPVYLTQ